MQGDSNMDLEGLNRQNDTALKKDKKVKNKFHFSFEKRIALLVVLIMTVFSFACYYILEALNYSSRRLVEYNETSNVVYTVCVQDSEYASGCIKEEDQNQYVSSIVNSINVKFNYDIEYKKDADYDLTYYVVGILKIYDKSNVNKIYYKVQDSLVDRSYLSGRDDKVHFEASSVMDFNKYNNIVADYKSKYSIETASSYDVILYIDQNNTQREIASVSIPLSRDVFSISKTFTTNVDQTLEVVNDKWDKYNTFCASISTVLIFITLFLLFKTTNLVSKATVRKSKYQRILEEILEEYDEEIVIVDDSYSHTNDKEVVKVVSFEELLDVKNTINKPILYSKVNSVKSEFYIEDEDKIYKYILKEADL